ncbi:unnamed protein product, partial [Staurois parvus]
MCNLDGLLCGLGQVAESLYVDRGPPILMIPLQRPIRMEALWL